MNILVTGATGFIGSYLCKELIGKNHQVIALSHSGKSDKVRELLKHKNFSLKIGDIQDTPLLTRLIKDNSIKSIFHLAAQLPNENDLINPFRCFDVNARGTLSILNAAYSNNVPQFMYASTMSVYAEPPAHLPVGENHQVYPPTVYGIAKLVGEFYCNLYAKAMNVVILRFAGAYGLKQRESDAIPTFIEQALKNKPLTLHGDGTQTSDFVYIEDIIQGTILAWEKAKSGIYNIGSGTETKIYDLARQIIQITGSKSDIITSQKSVERPFRFFMNIDKAGEALGYQPRSLIEGLKGYLEIRKERLP